MHEMAIISNLYQQVARIVEARPMAVREIEVEVGALQLVVPEALQLAWEAIRAGTAFEDATLKLIEVKAEARCRQCGRAFPVEMDCFLCPDCGQADAELLAGNDIVLRTITGESEEEAEDSK